MVRTDEENISATGENTPGGMNPGCIIILCNDRCANSTFGTRNHRFPRDGTISRVFIFFSPEFLRYLYKFPHIFIRCLLLSLSHSLLLSLPFSRGTSSPPSNRAIGFSPLQNLSDRKLNLPLGRSVRLSRSHFRSTEADPLHVLSFVLLARWKRSPRCSAE